MNYEHSGIKNTKTHRILDVYNLSELCEKTLRAFRLKYVITLLAAVVFISPNSLAQLDTAIVRTYGGPYYEEGRQIIECSAGGYAVIGTTGSDQPNNTNFYLLRLDEELNCIWNKNYGGAEVEWGYSIVEDANGNFLICGYTNSFGEGGYDILVYKVDTEGSVIWEKTYGGSDWDFAYKIIAHPTEGYLICGKTYSYGNGGSDAYLLHINDDGNLINEWTYGGEGDDEFRDLVFFNTKLNCILQKAGLSSQLLILDLGGNVNQTIEISDDQIVIINSLTGSDSNLYLCGKWLGDNSFYNCYLSSLNNQYITEWVEYGPEDYQYEFTAVEITHNELVYVGNTISFGYGNSEVLFQRRLFSSEWTAGPSFGSYEDEFAFDLIIDSQQRPIVVGTSNGYGSSEKMHELYLIRLQDSDLTNTYEEIEDLGLGCLTTDINHITSNSQPQISQSGRTIKLTDTNYNQLAIINGCGQTLIISNEKEFDLSHLPSGLYIVQCSAKSGRQNHAFKIILN